MFDSRTIRGFRADDTANRSFTKNASGVLSDMCQAAAPSAAAGPKGGEIEPRAEFAG